MKHLLPNRAVLRAIASGVLCAAIGFTAGADEPSEARRVYNFQRQETPEILESYLTTIYSAGQNGVQLINGESLYFNKKDRILDLALSPAGHIFCVVTTNKKGENKASVYSTAVVNERVHKFDIKKTGIPYAAAFTPDSRQLALATDRGIVLFETRKFKEAGLIPDLPFKPTDMVISSNGYYLAITGDKNAVIYNFEEKTVRKTIDAEVKINDLVFSPDNTKMAVLTEDGMLTIYDTRTFEVRTMLDDMGHALAGDFNDNSKYFSVSTAPDHIETVNTIRVSDRREMDVADGGVSELKFFSDANMNPMLAYTGAMKLSAVRMLDLEPYYSRLVSDAVDEKMAEWLKMQPGESMEDYRKRVNDESMAKQRTLYEGEISTDFAGDMLSMSSISFGNYDRANSRLTVNFTNLPSILLPVAENELSAFVSGEDLVVSDAQYGVLSDDSFELIYANFYNKRDGKTYVYNNLDRKPMDLMGGDSNFVSLDVLRQQQMEEVRLQELKQKVMAEAKQNNVISDHTNITVDSRVVPDYDANGNKILNYVVKYTYEVEPEFSAIEDFAPGKYKVEESGAASSMLKIVKQSLEGDLATYIKAGKRVNVTISGTADATPIRSSIAYDGSFGDFEQEPVTIDGGLTTISVTAKDGIRTNEQLAFLRAAAVKDNLEKNVKALGDMDARYNYSVSVSKDKGSEFRRITAEFVLVDAF